MILIAAEWDEHSSNDQKCEFYCNKKDLHEYKNTPLNRSGYTDLGWTLSKGCRFLRISCKASIHEENGLDPKWTVSPETK